MTADLTTSAARDGRSAWLHVRRTLRALLAAGLAAFPLNQLFTDTGWLIDVWVAMAITLLPAVIMRMWARPRLVHLLPGLVLLVAWLTLRYVPDHAVAGVIPLHGAWRDFTMLNGQLRDTVRDSVAPLHTTPPIRLVLSAGFAGLAVLIDAVAVVGRRPALAGIPLLLIYTLSGAIPRQPVSWLYFIPAAAGFLLLLSSDADDELPRWGRVMPRPQGAARPASALALSGRRIGLVAICAAVVLPFVLPSRSTNLIADALHGGSGNGTGSGGGGSGTTIDPFVSLKGQLIRGKPITLYNVTTTLRGQNQEPFYLRTDVLDTFDGSSWTSGGHGTPERLPVTDFRTTPAPTVGGATRAYQATITATAKGGSPAIFAFPTIGTGSVRGLSGASWSPQDGVALGTTLANGQKYTESVQEPYPTISQLQTDTTPVGPRYAQWKNLPANLPRSVSTLVTQLITGKGTPYAKADAILNHFSPTNGFTYSLETLPGDSTSDLVNFLTNRTGFCQQYAAAMAVMLRLAGIPARIALGYTHQPADANGHFSVSTSDAHAWVEAFFGATGWVPFDPTPLSDQDQARSANLPWAAHGTSPGTQTNEPTAHATTGSNASGATTTGALVGTSHASGWNLTGWTLGILAGAVLVLLIAAIPALVRARRRRSRLRASRGGDTDALWEELSATAVDLGYVWSPARSPRQVVGWLDSTGISGDARVALTTLAAEVERSRYSASTASRTTAQEPDVLIHDLRVVEAGLRERRSGRVRLAARLRPTSLGWSVPWLRRRTRSH
jgi:transglutaminase-like putative cysteine protease